MATRDDVRQIALALPEVIEDGDRFAFSVAATGKAKPKSFAWVWLERVDPKKGRVPNPSVLAIRVANLIEKDALLASDPAAEKFFTEAHYNGYPAVMVRLAAVDIDELEELLTEGWRAAAPKRLRSTFDATLG